MNRFRVLCLVLAAFLLVSCAHPSKYKVTVTKDFPTSKILRAKVGDSIVHWTELNTGETAILGQAMAGRVTKDYGHTNSRHDLYFIDNTDGMLLFSYAVSREQVLYEGKLANSGGSKSFYLNYPQEKAITLKEVVVTVRKVGKDYVEYTLANPPAAPSK